MVSGEKLTTNFEGFLILVTPVRLLLIAQLIWWKWHQMLHVMSCHRTTCTVVYILNT